MGPNHIFEAARPLDDTQLQSTAALMMRESESQTCIPLSHLVPFVRPIFSDYVSLFLF